MHSLIASIEIQETKGLYDCFKDNKKYLSPFNGIVWAKARLPEKFYRFGNAQVELGTSGEGHNVPIVKAIVNGDYNVQLALSIFFALGDEFGPSKADKNPASFLTPKHISQLLTLMDQAAEQSDKEQSVELFKAIFKDALDENQKNEKTQLGKQQYKTTLRQANKLVSIIIGALQETNSQSTTEQKYPRYTPYFLLLALLYEKAKNIDDLYVYCQNMPNALKDNWAELIKAKFDTANISIDQIKKKFDKATDKQEFIKNNYADMCYVEIQSQSQLGALPQFSKYEDISLNTDNGIVSFRCCVEAAVYNLILVLITQLGLYDKTKKVYSIEHLFDALKALLIKKQISFDEKELQSSLQKIKSFFIKYPKATPLEKNALIEWCQLVSNIPGVKYLQAKKSGDNPIKKEYLLPIVHIGQMDETSAKSIYGNNTRFMDNSFFLYEAAGVPSTYVQITNHLLGLRFKTFKQLANLFDLQNNESHEIEDDILYKGYSQGIYSIDVTLKGSVESKPFTIKIIFQVGHSACLNIGYGGEYRQRSNLEEKILTHTLLSYNTNFENQNLAALYLCNTPMIHRERIGINTKQSFFWYSKDLYQSLTPSYWPQLILSSNLFEEEMSLATLVTIFKEMYQQDKLLTNIIPLIEKQLSRILARRHMLPAEYWVGLLYPNRFASIVETLLLHFKNPQLIKELQDIVLLSYKQLQAKQDNPELFDEEIKQFCNNPNYWDLYVKQTTLDYSYQNLTSIPPIIYFLTNLRTLNLSHNKLTTLPPELKQLTKLNDLDLSYNLLTAIPSVLIEMKKQLESLNLNNNKIPNEEIQKVIPQSDKGKTASSDKEEIAAAIKNFESDDFESNDQAIKSFKNLFEKGIGYTEAIAIATNTIEKEYPFKGKQLFQSMIKTSKKHNQVYADEIEKSIIGIINNGFVNDNIQVIISIQELLTLLFELDRGFDFALQIANKMLEHDSFIKKREALSILIALTYRGRGYQTALKAIDVIIKSNKFEAFDTPILLLLTNLINQIATQKDKDPQIVKALITLTQEQDKILNLNQEIKDKLQTLKAFIKE